METCTLKSKVIHAFYWTHFKDNNCALMNWCVFLMKFLKRYNGQGRRAEGRKGQKALTFNLGLDLR